MATLRYPLARRSPSFDIGVDYDPAPDAEHSPPWSQNASRDPALLPRQISAIIGSYVFFVVVLGIMYLTIGRRIRASALAPRRKPDVEMTKPPAPTVRIDEPPLDPDLLKKPHDLGKLWAAVAADEHPGDIDDRPRDLAELRDKRDTVFEEEGQQQRRSSDDLRLRDKRDTMFEEDYHDWVADAKKRAELGQGPIASPRPTYARQSSSYTDGNFSSPRSPRRVSARRRSLRANMISAPKYLPGYSDYQRNKFGIDDGEETELEPLSPETPAFPRQFNRFEEPKTPTTRKARKARQAAAEEDMAIAAGQASAVAHGAPTPGFAPSDYSLALRAYQDQGSGRLQAAKLTRFAPGPGPLNAEPATAATAHSTHTPLIARTPMTAASSSQYASARTHHSDRYNGLQTPGTAGTQFTGVGTGRTLTPTTAATQYARAPDTAWALGGMGAGSQTPGTVLTQYAGGRERLQAGPTPMTAGFAPYEIQTPRTPYDMPRTPRTAGMFTPMTAGFAPRTPVTPYTPRAVTREQRRRVRREEQGGTAVTELAKSDRELWDAY